MFLVFWLFWVGDVIEMSVILGIVCFIGIFMIELEMVDGFYCMMLNLLLWNVLIINFSWLLMWCFELNMKVGYEENIESVSVVFFLFVVFDVCVLKVLVLEMFVVDLIDVVVVVMLCYWIMVGYYWVMSRDVVK